MAGMACAGSRALARRLRLKRREAGIEDGAMHADHYQLWLPALKLPFGVSPFAAAHKAKASR
jgi:hypothetical protein